MSLHPAGSAALAAAARCLRCPHCGADLFPGERTLACAGGHSYDVARQGHVALLAPARRAAAGDSEEMVAARDAFLDAGHYAPIVAALTAAARGRVDPPGRGPGCVVDLGCGTGHHLAAVLRELAGWDGLALDSSRAALRRAVRADPRIAAVVCDAWGPLPVKDGAADLVLSVFAPRNAAEIRRMLAERGTLIVVTPGPDHLGELVARLGMIGVDPDKPGRLHAKLSSELRATSVEPIDFEMTLDHAAARALAGMGPSAHHVSPDELRQRVARLPDELRVTASVRLETFVRR